MGENLDSERNGTIEPEDCIYTLLFVLLFTWEISSTRGGKGNHPNTSDFSLHTVLEICIQLHISISMRTHGGGGGGNKGTWYSKNYLYTISYTNQPITPAERD